MEVTDYLWRSVEQRGQERKNFASKRLNGIQGEGKASYSVTKILLLSHIGIENQALKIILLVRDSPSRDF